LISTFSSHSLTSLLYVAFQTAVSLSLFQFFTREVKDEDENPELEQEHFEDICRMTTKFKKHLRNVAQTRPVAQPMRETGTMPTWTLWISHVVATTTE